MVVGRDNEENKLLELFEKERSEFVVVYGRRRVGKTFLIRQTFENKFSFYVTGMANTTLTNQLANFNYALQQFGRKEVLPPSTWLEAFQELIKLLEKSTLQKKVVFIDELPWMDTPRSGFLAAFEHFWNHWASARKDVLLIACGSASSWIINNLLNNTGGLHNRVTQKLKINPFKLNACEAFFQYKNIPLNRYQIIELYMVFGGIPFYLEAVAQGQSAAQNIDRLCFGSDAYFKNEFANLYQSLFKKSENHIAIVSALSKKTKGLTRSEISEQSKIPTGGSFTKALKELEESGFIRVYTPLQKKVKDSLYQLTDAFSLFYMQFLNSNPQNNSGDWIAMYDSPKHRVWAGFAFERVCLQHINQIKTALGINGIQSSVSSWRSTQKADGAQIDLLIERKDQVINVCEMKFSIHPFTITKSYAAELRNKIGVFQQETETKMATFLTMISTYGVAPNEHSIGLIQNEITMDALFAPSTFIN